MNEKTYNLMAAILIAVCWAVVSGSARADADTARYAAMGQACSAQNGEFDLSWIYTDSGRPWGRVLSCATPDGFVACQGGFCRSRQWQSAEVAPTAGPSAGTGGKAEPFAADPEAFAKALQRLDRR